jgi:hypothetical protein
MTINDEASMLSVRLEAKSVAASLAMATASASR